MMACMLVVGCLSSQKNVARTVEIVRNFEIR
jgi:hypothetical protein